MSEINASRAVAVSSCYATPILRRTAGVVTVTVTISTVCNTTT